MALMAPILRPRQPVCCTCRHWRHEVDHALGGCGHIPYDQRRDAEGRLIRAAHTRAGDQFACHEPMAA